MRHKLGTRLRQAQGKRDSNHRGPRKISEVMADLLAQRGYAQARAADDCLIVWRQVAGELGHHSVPGVLKRGILRINVRNSAVLQELTFRKLDLLRALGRALPHHRISDLRFQIGSFD